MAGRGVDWHDAQDQNCKPGLPEREILLMSDHRALRRRLYEQYRTSFAAAPIRLISKIDQEARRQAAAAGETYDGFAGAIGDIAADSLSEELRNSLYFGREAEVRAEGEHRLRAETPRFTSYDYGGTGYNCLKEAWLDVYRPLSPETAAFRVYPGYGGTHAFSLTVQALARQFGNRAKVLVPVPSFPPFFFQLGRHFELVCVPTRIQQGMRLQAEDVADIPATALRLVYLCVVGNPTGRAYGADELAATMAAILRREPEALLLLDAVYLRTLPPAEAAALWRTMTAPAVRRNVIIFDSLSKSYGRTGLRSGVVFMANERLEQHLTDLMQNELAGLSYAMQIESVGLLRLVSETAVQALACEIAGRRERFLARGLASHGQWLMPRAEQPLLPAADWWQGGLYALLQLRPGADALEFFLETGVAGIAGAAFFGPARDQVPAPLIRLSFGMGDVPR